MTDHDFLQIPVSNILPQKSPFVMISNLVHYDDDVTTTRFVISEDNLFCQDGVFSACGVVENIAQTAAARIGYINKYILHKDVNIGYIGAVRSLEINRLPKVGELIETTLHVLNDVMGITLVSSSVRVVGDNSIIAQGEMKIVLSEVVAE